MTAPLYYDPLDDSSRLIAVLEQHRTRLPFADEALAQHQMLHGELLHQRSSSEQALEEWRHALAQRWQCEVAGRRVYLRIQQALVEHFGEESPALLLFIRSDEGNGSAAELLADLQRLHAALCVTEPPAIATRDYLPELTHICEDLEAAIAWTSRCDQQRRKAVLDRHLGQHAYQRIRSKTRRLLREHLGEWTALER